MDVVSPDKSLRNSCPAGAADIAEEARMTPNQQSMGMWLVEPKIGVAICGSTALSERSRI